MIKLIKLVNMSELSTIIKANEVSYKVVDNPKTFDISLTDSNIEAYITTYMSNDYVNVDRRNTNSKATIKYTITTNYYFNHIMDGLIGKFYPSDTFSFDRSEKEFMKDALPFDSLNVTPLGGVYDKYKYTIEIDIDRLNKFMEDKTIFDHFFGYSSKYNISEKFVIYLTCILMPLSYLNNANPFESCAWYNDITKKMILKFNEINRFITLNETKHFIISNMSFDILLK